MGIDKEVNEQFINTVTIHILSVSGLHIGFLTGILVMLTSLIRVPRRMRFFVIAPVLILYAYVVGMVPSISRAVIMALVILFGLTLQRRSLPLNSLGFAALLILIFSPSQLFSPGFQLSFAAVMSIAFFHQKILAMVHVSYPSLIERPFLNSVTSLSVLSVAATLGTVPLTAYYFNRISSISVIANLFIVPLSGVFTTLAFTFVGISAVSSALAAVYGAAAQIVGYAILSINALLGSMSISNVKVADSSWVFAALYFFWLVAVIGFGRMTPDSSRKNMPAKKLLFGLLFGADIILYSTFLKPPPEAKLYVLDVGQGDAIYMEFPDGKNVLVDAGMKFGNRDVGEQVIMPFLERNGVTRLDQFVVTHLHSDHIGGAETILGNLKIGRFVYPDQKSQSTTWLRTLASAKARGIPCFIAAAGTVLDSESNYRVYVLHPNRKYVGEGGLAYKTRFNDGSIVLKVCIGYESFLLVGDIEKRVEDDLIRIYGTFLSSDIYKAGHHGSSTSSSPEFLKTVHPSWAVISVGARNSFGHPSHQVIDEMRRDSIRVWRTDSLGAAFFTAYTGSLRMVEWK